MAFGELRSTWIRVPLTLGESRRRLEAGVTAERGMAQGRTVSMRSHTAHVQACARAQRNPGSATRHVRACHDGMTSARRGTPASRRPGQGPPRRLSRGAPRAAPVGLAAGADTRTQGSVCCKLRRARGTRRKATIAGKQSLHAPPCKEVYDMIWVSIRRG